MQQINGRYAYDFIPTGDTVVGFKDKECAHSTYKKDAVFRFKSLHGGVAVPIAVGALTRNRMGEPIVTVKYMMCSYKYATIPQLEKIYLDLPRGMF